MRYILALDKRQAEACVDEEVRDTDEDRKQRNCAEVVRDEQARKDDRDDKPEALSD